MVGNRRNDNNRPSRVFLTKPNTPTFVLFLRQTRQAFGVRCCLGMLDVGWPGRRAGGWKMGAESGSRTVAPCYDGK